MDEKEFYQREFHSKIMILEELISYAEKKSLGSQARAEYGNLISVVLRNLLTEELIEICGHNKILLFPLYSPIAALNIIPFDYTLLQEVFSGNVGALQVRDDLCVEDRIYTTYLDFQSWLHESIIDFKDDSFAPLSRWDVVKLIADKRGAHYQVKGEARFEKLISENVMPMVIVGTNGQYTQSNLYIESIIGIAKELTFSYRHTLFYNPTLIGESKLFCYKQVYPYKDTQRVFGKNKYVVCANDINAYNANEHFKCKVIKTRLSAFFLFGDRNCVTHIISSE